MKNRTKLSIFSLLIFLILEIFLPGYLSAQETGEINGKVIDEEGIELPSVSITAVSVNLQGKRTALTGNDGIFRLPLLPIGVYTLTFEIQGFTTLVQEDVGVKLGMVTSVNIVMSIATIKQQLTITAEAPLIDKTKADTSFHMGTKELASAPVQSRTIYEILQYTPGVTGVRNRTNDGVGGGGTAFGSGSVRGEGASGNNWLIDGLSKREMWNHGDMVRTNYDSWEEVQIISDGFSPELGQATGGIINIVTKSGGNQFHGELGALIMDHSFRAARKEQLAISTEPEISTHNYFGNIGGPIVKDKLWFFISDNVWHTASDMVGGAIGWLTIPAGKMRVNTNNLFGKLTYAPYQNHTFSFSGTSHRFLNQSGGLGFPELYSKSNFNNYAYRLSYKGIFGPSTLFEATIGRASTHNRNEPLSGDLGPPQFYFVDIGQNTNNLFTVAETNNKRTDFTSRFTQYIDTDKFGNHEIGLGFLYYYQYRDELSDFCGKDYDLWPGNGFEAGSRVMFLTQGAPYQIWEYAERKFYNDAKGFGLYIKDKITFGNVSVLLGVRTETQKLYNDLGEEILSLGLSKFISPRFSLAWDITGDGVNVFKVGVGQFTDTWLFDFLGGFNRQGGIRFRNYGWIGPTDPTEAQLKDPANWNFIYQQGYATGAIKTFKEGTVPSKMTKVVVEYDRRLGTNWALKLRGIYSNHPNQLDDLGYFTYTTYFFRMENWDQKRRKYKGIEVEINGRIADKFYLNASYVWSEAKGTTPGDQEQIGGWMGLNTYNTNSIFGDHLSGPADSPLAWLGTITEGMGGKDYGDEGWYGYLPYSCDHVIKILGTYLAPYGITITANFEVYSGYHWSIWGFVAAYGVYGSFPYGRGTEKLPTHSYLDISIQKDFALVRGIAFGLRLNVSNLLNSQQPLSYINGDGSPLFGEVYGRQFPRWFQFQALFRF